MVEADGKSPITLATVVRRISQDIKVLPFLSKAELEVRVDLIHLIITDSCLK